MASTLCFVILTCQMSHGQQAQPNFPAALQNAGFEEGEPGQTPSGWSLPGVCAKAGYSLRISHDRPLVGKHCAEVRRQADDAPTSFGNMMQAVSAESFRGKRVRLRAAVRTEVAGAGNQAQLWFRVDRPQRRPGFFDNMENRPITAKDWKHYEIVGDIAADAQSLVFGMFLRGNGLAAVDDVTLEIVDAEVPATAVDRVAHRVAPAPGLTELRMAATVRAKGPATTVTYLYPLPLSYRDQVPLSFQLQVEPPQAARSAEIVESAGDNRVLKLTLHELDKHPEVQVSYRSVVLVGPTRFADAPKSAAFPAAWPDEARPWLRATWCCDHEDERIRKLSAKVRGDTADVMQVIANALAEAKQTFAQAQGRVENLTAVEALEKRGSCTSCANLMAALLRGSGVPARVLAGYPLWSGPLQTHYIVEAYVPEFGWYPIESTRCLSPWANHQQVNVSIVPLEHESQEKAGRRATAAGAVPYLSLTEMETPAPNVWSTGTLQPFRDHECRMIRPIEAADAEWAAALDWARPRWNDWLRSKLQLENGRLAFALDASVVKAKTLQAVREEFQ